MPRKIRQLKADLGKAGFVEDMDSGNGSHTSWVHPGLRCAKIPRTAGPPRTGAGNEGVPAANDATIETALTGEDLAATRRYAIVIEWPEEDQVFVVTVPDLPGCRTHGATRDEAARMGEEAIATWLASDAKWGIASPEPRFTALVDLQYASVVSP